MVLRTVYENGPYITLRGGCSTGRNLQIEAQGVALSVFWPTRIRPTVGGLGTAFNLLASARAASVAASRSG